MEPVKVYVAELEIGSSLESFRKFLESQQSLFHSQIGHLQNVVATQCKLTGVNPLSQEMAAGALFVKIGKRPRDLLNPKAVNYMHSVFSIKDAVTKKEIRDISARFGMTATQVKEYFTNQRSRVRRLVRLSREKALRDGFSVGIQDEAPLSSVIPVDPDPLCSIAPLKSEEPPPCSNQHEVLHDIADSDKNFVDNIFGLMRKEDTFSGQVKLMEWILQIKNPFLARGGLMILATWLSQAASEEQTSVLYVVLKVLTFLPLNRALPVHMSAIIQSVNKLRFYGKADVSNRARALLSCWSKMFGKSQAIKRLNGVKSSCDSNDEIDLKQRISELMSDELEQHVADMSEDACYRSVDETRRLESPHAIKLLTASADDSNKRLVLGIATHKERRKVLLVEQPGQKTPGKNQQVVKAANASSNARPITADEIQKARLRAQFMQSKHDKVGSPSKDNDKSKSNDSKRPSSLLTNDLLSASEAYLRPKLEAHKKAKLLPQKNTKHIQKVSDPKPTCETEIKLAVVPKRVRIPWQVPPEMRPDGSWKLCSGEKSKEGDAQRNRISREKESVYMTREEVPPNPKEPWDIEMDYDDTLTPEIPIEQLPETDTGSSTTSSVPVATAQPDLELLALLLKNPQLVFALTSSSSSSSNPDTIRLLDLLKNNSSVLTTTEASLPSPTPNAGLSLPSPTPAVHTTTRSDVSLPSTPTLNAAPSGWGQETLKNPFSRQSSSTPLQQHQASATLMTHVGEQQRPSSSRPHASLNQPANNYHHFQQHNNNNNNNNMLEQSHYPGGPHHVTMPVNSRQHGGWAGHSSESRRYQDRSGHGRNNQQGAWQDRRGPWRHDEDLTGFTDQRNGSGRRWTNQDRSSRR